MLKNKNTLFVFMIILVFLFISAGYYFKSNQTEVKQSTNLNKPKVKKDTNKPLPEGSRAIASVGKPVALGPDPKQSDPEEPNKEQNNDGEPLANNISEENNLVTEEFSQIDLTNKIIEKNNEVELISPKLITSEGFYCEHNRRKVPIKLEWEAVAGATSYEVIVHRQYKDKKIILRTVGTNKHIKIYPNARYKWKVLAFKNKELISNAATDKNLYVKAPEGAETVSQYEKNYPDFTGEYEKVNHNNEFNLNYVSKQPISEQLEEKIIDELATRKIASVKNNDYTLWSRLWVHVGTGLNLTSYEQEIFDAATLAYDAVKSPNFRGEVGFFVSDKMALVGSGFKSPGNLVDEETDLNEEYTWTSYSLEGIYLFGDGKVSNKVKSNWYMRYGLHQHELPLLEVFPSSSELFILENTLINFGIGLGNRTKFSKDLRTDMYLRYQHPISSKANKNTYSLDSGMLIDFYIAANYQLHRNFHMGAFLNSQYFNLDYSLANGFESVQGTQSLFNNIFGLYLGFEL